MTVISIIPVIQSTTEIEVDISNHHLNKRKIKKTAERKRSKRSDVRPYKGRITLLAPYRGNGCVGALIH
jgi:hypothetical protein